MPHFGPGLVVFGDDLARALSSMIVPTEANTSVAMWATRLSMMSSMLATV
jgi:hypothetical protein